MKNTFRHLSLATALTLGSMATAQMVVTITGTVTPCMGVIYPVHIVTNSIPSIDTTVYTGANCEYSFTFFPVATQGTFVVETSCDGGTTWSSGTGAWNPFFPVVVMDLSCSGGPCILDAFGYLTSTTPWEVTFAAGAGNGTLPYNYAWTFWNGSTSSLPIETLTLTDPGSYTACLTVTDGVGCVDDTCFTFMMDADGNMTIANTFPCEACVQLVQSTDGPAGPPVPWALEAVNCSSGGVQPVQYDYQWSTGETTQSITAAGEGQYLVCVFMQDVNGCQATTCDSVYVDVNGNVSSTPPGDLDCLGVPGGAAVVGSSCDDGNPATFYDMYMPNCTCAGVADGECYTWVDWGQVTQSGTPVPFEVEYSAFTAGALPITYSWYFGDVTIGLPFVLEGTSSVPTWSRTFSAGESLAVQVVAVDANGCESTWTNVEAIMPCDGVLGSLNIPTLPCFNPITEETGVWSSDCECIVDAPACQAGFWPIQAYGPDSLPIPNELWIWNLSSGGTGNFQFLWNFGDGTSSTEAFPSHDYPANGPYELCLTITDDAGCTDTYCDEISIDENGLYNGFVQQPGMNYARPDHDRSSGFTINVRNPIAASVPGSRDFIELAAWPNPTQDRLEVTFTSSRNGQVGIDVLDANGRRAFATSHQLMNGANRMRLDLQALPAGMYLLRIGEGDQTITRRFVKVD